MFFKAGVLARLEDARDEQLSKIIVGLQAIVRKYIAQKDSERRRKQMQSAFEVYIY